ncbi:hypothetical protein PIROE2DRAFT_15051 [Piromyces sp. E2]|nr:hypothetical protein PIROE2DRAFT_15051 [Piromyces sp. E2]|eukprot:OUM59419.1 hypothetical protein PIROE2DRAFT_15051 [Piromyces sp. E2]
MEMEDYLYEKKKKFEMMKNRAKKNNANSDLKLQSRQCEKSILNNYDFKTKSNELEPMKNKVMLKKRQSTEKSLTINHSIDDDSCFTNTIYLQEDEFSLEEKINETNLVSNTIQSSDETINNTNTINNIEIEDIIISKRESSLNFQKSPSFDSSLIEIISSLQDSISVRDAASSSNGGLSQSQRQNSSYSLSSESGKLQKKKSFSSFIQKQTSGVLKKVRSLIQNSNEDVTFGGTLPSDKNNSISTDNSMANEELESKHKKKSKNKSSSSTEDGFASQRSHKKTFSLSSFKLKSSKSNISINNAPPNNELPSKKPLSHKGSITKSIMKKLDSLKNMGSRKNSSNSINHDSDDSDAEKKFSIGKCYI